MVHFITVLKLGSYHTIDLEPEKQLKLSKNEWDSVAIAYLRQAANEVKADLGAIIVQEGASLAFICTLNPSQGAPRVLERVALGSGAAKKANNPYGGGSASEKQQEKFYNLLHESIKRHLDCSRYKAIVLVVGPRTGLETVYTRLMDLSSKEAPSPKTTDCKSGLADNKSKIVKVPVSLAKDAHPDALCSVLSDPRISALLANTKSAIEARMMDQLCKSLHVSEDSTAVHHGYGTFAIAHVEQAAEAGAIKHLLIADRLFRSCQVEERKRYARLIGTVDANGGSTVIVGSDGLQEGKKTFLNPFHFRCRINEAVGSRCNPSLSNSI